MMNRHRIAAVLMVAVAAGMQARHAAAEPFTGKVSGITSQDPFEIPTIEQPRFGEARVEVREFGATGDGNTNDTAAINKAIEKVSSMGGGTVHFSKGRYMAASIHLASNLRLLLDDGAAIVGLKLGYDTLEPNEFGKYQDAGHSHYHDSVMWGEHIENFAIIGGEVTGGGASQSDKPAEGGQGGTKVIAIKVGKNLLFKGVTHVTGAHFVYLLNDCENVTLDHVVIKKSRDAIDLMGCRNVAVTGCNFTGCVDDTLGIKSDYALGRRILSENIYAWDNYFESGCNGLQFGSETAGDFRHIRCWNIRIGLSMKAGIGITCNDSAVIEDVKYRDIEVTHAANPIYILITDRLRTGEAGVKPGKIKDVTLENITITEAKPGRQGPVNPTAISGLPGYTIDNVTLENVKIVMPGGGTAEDAQVVPPYPKDYSPRSLGVRPASAFYIRHVRGLTMKNVAVSTEEADARPAVVMTDAEGVTFDHVSLPKNGEGEVIRAADPAGMKVIDSPGVVVK